MPPSLNHHYHCHLAIYDFYLHPLTVYEISYFKFSFFAHIYTYHLLYKFLQYHTQWCYHWKYNSGLISLMVLSNWMTLRRNICFKLCPVQLYVCVDFLIMLDFLVLNQFSWQELFRHHRLLLMVNFEGMRYLFFQGCKGEPVLINCDWYTVRHP